MALLNFSEVQDLIRVSSLYQNALLEKIDVMLLKLATHG